MYIRAIFTGFLLLILGPLAGAFETDQFTHRYQQIADSQSLLNRKVNLAIGESILGVSNADEQMVITNRIYRKLGGPAVIDKIEGWAMRSDEIERLSAPASHSIYAGIPIWATRLTGFAGVSPTIKVNNVLMGTDKLGHFFSQGRKFYVRWRRVNDAAKAAKQSALTERAFFGQLITGSYSNADLVANYEGFRFYRSLFEPDPLTGKTALLSWQGDHWIMQRPFEWSDHVNDYWDEALNINHYDIVLYPYIKKYLLLLCEWYHQYSNLYQIHNDAGLKQRYDFLQFKDSSELRLNNLCINSPPARDPPTSVADR